MMCRNESTDRQSEDGDRGKSLPHADHTARQELTRRSCPTLQSCQARTAFWLLLFALALGVIFSSLSWEANSRDDRKDVSVAIPRSASGLALFLQEKFPKARIISTRVDGPIDRSFLLTMSGSDERKLRSLPRMAERGRQWQGTVLCEYLTHWETAELLLEQWGEYGLARPPFVFFGDKKVLETINQALQEVGHEHRNSGE
jgi:hypothetical protein